MSKNGASALMYSVGKHPNLKILNLLIENGADLNLKWKEKNAFGIACKRQNLDVLPKLIEHGVNIESQKNGLELLKKGIRFDLKQNLTLRSKKFTEKENILIQNLNIEDIHVILIIIEFSFGHSFVKNALKLLGIVP